jgi:hypothetical protein
MADEDFDGPESTCETQRVTSLCRVYTRPVHGRTWLIDQMQSESNVRELFVIRFFLAISISNMKTQTSVNYGAAVYHQQWSDLAQNKA